MIILLFFSPGNSQKIDEQLFKNITQKLRCMTCQNQTIYESETDFSRDVKRLVQEKLRQGQSAKQIEEFLVKRYGEYILFEPRLDLKNLILWAFPFLIFCISLFVLAMRLKVKDSK